MKTVYLEDFQYDSLWLVERQKELDIRAYESKRAEFKLEIICAAILDFTNHNSIALKQIISDYLDEEDRKEIDTIYKLTIQLLKKLTEKQKIILYHFLVDRFTVTEIAKKLNIKKQTVFKQIKSIQKKGIKLLEEFNI